ncbi:ATP-binding cassette sub-family A member 1, partial [Gryllus bimaculatus]
TECAHHWVCTSLGVHKPTHVLKCLALVLGLAAEAVRHAPSDEDVRQDGGGRSAAADGPVNFRHYSRSTSPVLGWRCCQSHTPALKFCCQSFMKCSVVNSGQMDDTHFLRAFLHSPGPRMHPFMELKYFTSGFIYIQSSAPSLVLVFLLSYCAASTAFACLLSVFFSRASVAAAVCGMVFVLSYLPYATLDLWGHWDTPAIKYIVGLLSNVAFGFGCLYLSSFELLGVGATWERARRSPYDNDDYSLLASMVAMLVDALLYMLLAWYISNVWPGAPLR